jgi:hypothetical protein
MASKKWQEENQELLRKYRRDWYARNKRRGIVKSAVRRKDLKVWFRELKKDIPARCAASPIQLASNFIIVISAIRKLRSRSQYKTAEAERELFPK